MRNLGAWVDRNIVYLIIGIISFATALRIYHIDYQSLWLDELYSIVPSDPQKPIASIFEHSKHEQPPLFYIYLHYVFALFGYNEHIGRMACAVLGLLGIFAVYFLGKECLGKSVGQFAAFLTAISFFHVYYSQELRFYTMTFLFSTLSYLFFIRAYKKSRVVDFAFYSVFTVLLMYTHYYGIIIFASQALTFLFLLYYKRDARFIVYSVISATVVVLAFIPWMPVVLKSSRVTKFWIETPSPFFIAVYFYAYTGKEIITTLVFLVFIFFFVKWYRESELVSDESKRVGLIIILWIGFSYLIPYVRSLVSTPLLHERYTMVTLPAWFVLLAIGWNKIKNSWRYVVPPILVLAFMINMAFFKKHYTRIEKDQFRESSELVKFVNTNHYPILSQFPWHYNYYFRNNADKVADLNATDLTSVNEFWLLQAHATDEEMRLEVEGLLESFNEVEKHEFFGANAILMRRK